MKRKPTVVAAVLAAVIIVLSSFNAAAVFAAGGTVRVVLDGVELEFDAQPRIVNDRTLVPLRGIFEAMGATVLWNGDTETVTALRLDAVVKLVVGAGEARVNKEVKPLDVPARLIENRTFVPLRFISESMGAKVDWDDATKTVTVTTDKAHWSDPGDNLTLNLVFASEWVNNETDEIMKFDPETFIEINDSWPYGPEDGLFYSYSETFEPERNMIGMFVGGGHLKDHWMEFDTDTRVLTEYMFDEALASWHINDN